MDRNEDKQEISGIFLGSPGLEHHFSRRQFLKLSGASIIGISGACVGDLH